MERRDRKITPKRGGCDDTWREFSECCNRHEWGLIDGFSSVVVRASRREILQIFITREPIGTSGRRMANESSAKKRRGRAISITRARGRAQLYGQTHSGITNYSGKWRELCESD